MKKLLLFFLIVLPLGCSKISEQKIIETRSYMHTFVQIQILSGNPKEDYKIMNKAFDAVAEVETNTSRFIASSDVSKIKNAPSNQKIKVSSYTFNCLSLAKKLNKKTNGKYDVTISPLVDLWGFGKNKNTKIPSKEKIVSALKKIGSDKFFLFRNCNAISTSVNNLDIDLSSVAKGAAVDAAAQKLLDSGISNFLINAGGEIRTSSTGEKIWHVGIQKPELNASSGDVITNDILKIKNKAVATSGNYRNYFKHGTNFYFHIINPKTGFPLKTSVMSITVTAPTCAEADAWATAFFTLSPEEAIKLANKTPKIECFIIERPAKGENNFIFHKSKNFDAN